MPLTSRIGLADFDSPRREDEDQGLTQFGAGFSAGLKQTQGLLGGGLPALINSALGNEEATLEYLDYYNQKMQEAAEIGSDFQRVEDIDGAEDAVQWLTYTLGKALPDIGTSIIGGGVSGAAVKYGAKKYIAENVERDVKKKAGDAFEKAMVKKELARRTAKARRVGAAIGGYGTSIALNAGETFANVYEESGGIQDPALALGTGIAAGALDALAPMSILKKILPDNMAEPFKEAMVDRLLRNKGMVQRAFIEGVRTGGIEGATEAAQEVLQATAVGMFNDPESGYKSYGESFFDALNNPTEQQKSQYLNAFAAGLVGGGGMGGISGAMYKPRSAPEVQEEDPQQSPMPDSEGNMPVETPQSEELEAQQAGFESYVDYLDAYESGPARRNRGVSLEAIQNIIPDEYYLGQDISEDENARLEAETLQLRDEFNPSLNDLVGQVVGQDDSEGVLRRREDGVFAYTDFQTGEEIIIESGEANQDQPAEVSGLEQRDSTVELEGGRGVTFNAEDSTFTARRGTFRYFSTNYDENGEVATVTAETMDGEPRTFGKKMAKAIEDAKAGVEMQQMRSDLANQIVQADDLPEDLQVALVQADVLEETIPVEQVEEIIQTMPEARQEPLRKRIESLMTRDEMMETPIAASTFDRTDETNIFNGVINRAGSVTLEERQANLDATAGQEIQQPNGDDPIVIPSTGLDGIAEKVATAMRNQFKVRNEDKTVSFYQPANKYLGEANQDIAEEIQQAVFDLVESGMAPEAISSLEQISVHTEDDFNGADAVALASGVSLRDGMVDKARTDEGASALRFILAHEMHHVFDLNNNITRELPSFNVEIAFTAEGPVMTAGDVVMELYENYVNETEVGRLFAYPFNMLDEDTQDLNADFDMLGRTMEQEVFAQLGAVYVSDPRLLKSQAPEAYEVIRTIRGADNATDQNTETQVQPEGTGVQGEVRPSTVSGSAEVEDAGGTGVVGGDGAEAGPTSEVVGGETQQQDGDSDGRVVRPEDLVIKRADNFSTNGEYNVTFPDGTVTQIFRDTLQFSTPRWIWVESDANSPEAIFGIGDNRNEAVQRLIQLMGYDLPAPDDVLLSRGSGSKVDKSRRELLRKIATVAVVSGSGFKGTSYVAEIASNPELVRGKAKPISDFVQRPLPEESVSALASGDLPKAIDIAVAGAPQDVIDLAERIKATLPEQDLYDTDVQRGQWNVAGMVRLKDTPTITIMPDTKDSGMTGTLLHEAMHLGIAARYRSLSTVASSNYELLGMDQPKAREALDQWNSLWSEFRRAVNPNLQRSKVSDLPFETQVAYGSPDEFFVRALTQPEFQQQLHEIDYEGKTLLERFKDWVKRYLFGPDTGVQPTYLDAAMTAANDLFDAATLDSPDFAFMRGINAELAQQRDGAQNEIVDRPLFMRSPMGLASARETAAATSYPNQRPFKVDLQQKSLDEQERMGLNLREDTEEANKYLVEITVSDAKEALVDNENAIGWYDRTVREAIDTLAKIHPEIATDPQAKFAFTFALANTSNGLKVDKNFELAESAYRAYKEAGDGKFPTNVGIGNAAAAINKTFKLFNDMVEQYGINDVMELFNSKTTVGELQKAGFKVTGEWVDTEVYGAAIIGPKIGNGFFANLNGNFDQLTMDRWLRRTWGRWTGTLIGERPDLIADKTKKMRQIVAKMTAEEKRSFKELGVNIRTQSNADVIDTANAIQKASMVPANREVMNRTDLGQDLRKVGNGLAKDADGQIEAPTAAERNRIRRVFNEALKELRNDYPELTMADLQALLWYPEKRLYDGARSQEEFENGYEDAEAPDYANAAARLAERFGVDSDRRGAGDARSGDVAEQPAVAEQAEGTATPELVAQEPEVDTPLAKRGQKKSHADAQRDNTLLDGTPSSNEFTLDDETRLDLFLRRIQDQYLSLKKFEDAAAEFLGLKELPEHMQTYVGETLHSGKVKTDLDDLENNYISPMAEILRENDIDPDDFGLYLMAKHAPERNARIAKMYEEQNYEGPLPDFIGAGMTTEDANRVVAELENASMLKAADIVYKMLAKNRERMVEAGLINEETADSWDSTYEFYVPLKGFATSESDDGLTPPRGLPKGFSVSGKESFKALGRVSQAENPVLFAIADSEEKITRARRNEVGQQFLALADAIQERGSEQLKVYRPEDDYPMGKREADAKGKVSQSRMTAQTMRTAKRDDDSKIPRFMSVKVDGEEVFIEIKNHGLARAMHNVGAENFENLSGFLGAAAPAMQKFQNFRRNMLINWNPSWFLINPLRDLQTGLMYNLAQESKEGGMVEGENLTGEIIRRYLPAYSAYYKNLRGNKADNEYDAYFDEYQKSGAPTGLTLTKEIEEQRERLFALVTDGPLTSKGKQGLQQIEYLNQASENAIRFATYVSARESGVSVQSAANLAKNLTVNFNRKGEMSAGLNLFYLFFNAAVQGTANIAQAMSGRTADGSLTKAQIGAASIALVAYMVTQHNLGAADEDDDGESLYNDLSDYDHLMSWNMVLDDGKTFAQIPMPYGYGFFHTLGRLGAEYMNETKDEGDVAAELTASFAHHMLPPPLGFVGSVGTVDDLDEFGKRMLGNVAPSIFEPVVQYATNTNHFGSPLYLEDNPLIRPSAPDSSRAKRSTSQVYRDIAEWMNDATGGSLYRSGAVDVSPDGMQYLQEYLLGGLGRFVNRSADLAAKYNSPEDEEITASDVPIVRYFFGEPSDYADKMDYYDYIGSATQIFKENEEATGAERLEFQREFGSVTKLEPLYKETQKQLRKLRQRKKQIEKTQKDPVKAYDQIQKIEAEMQKLYDRFNQRYREATR